MEKLAVGESTTETIKLDRNLSESELLQALKQSMDPIFEHFEEKLVKEGDGKTLHIAVTVNEGKISLQYGIGPVEEL